MPQVHCLKKWSVCMLFKLWICNLGAIRCKYICCIMITNVPCEYVLISPWHKDNVCNLVSNTQSMIYEPDEASVNCVYGCIFRPHVLSGLGIRGIYIKLIHRGWRGWCQKIPYMIEGQPIPIWHRWINSGSRTLLLESNILKITIYRL